MFKGLLLLSGFFLLSCGNTIYVVRHAEKETTTEMSTDVLLSDAGKVRAQALKDALHNQNIQRIFSTNTLRTLATATPLSEAAAVSIELYEPGDKSFAARLKRIKRGNVLVVGHSNTVDDVVNGLLGQTELTDLRDDAYDNLFVVKRRSKGYYLSRRKYGAVQE